ncbi:MAG: DUF4149 domain-containing protein [Candidatus Velthaea sp.]
MWTANRSRVDRILAAVEIPALGLWVGSLCAFAFVFAPAAFRVVGGADVGRFGALIGATLGELTALGYACGAIAIITALVRSREAGDRTYDFARAALVLFALALIWYESASVVPAMTALADVTSPAYRALHQRSTTVYGLALLFDAVALVMAAARRES